MVFLKTHKTGSSTIQNVLYRFATRHECQLALNKNPDVHLLNYDRPFSMATIAQASIQPNMITNHMVFSPDVRKLMPVDSRYVTGRAKGRNTQSLSTLLKPLLKVVRDPYSQLLSSFNYFHFFDFFKDLPMGVNGLKQFLSDPSAYNRSPSNRSVTSDLNLIIALNLICHFYFEVNILSKIPTSSTWDTQTP